MGRVFLVGVGWIWAWSAGKEKIALYQHLIPGPSVFLSFKSGVTFFLWVWHWSCLFSFQYRGDFTAVYQHHMDDISGQQLSLWVVLSGNAHIVANSPISFWDVIGSEWVIAIEF